MRKRTLPAAWFGLPGTAAEIWDTQRTLHVLGVRLAAERRSLETWQRRLALRTDWEQTHDDPTQLPALRQACAACHARVLDLERQIAQTRVQLRALGCRPQSG